MQRWALLVIDVQESFKLNHQRWANRSTPDFEQNVTRLIELFRKNQQAIIFILHNDEDEGFRPDDPAAVLMPFIKPEPTEPVLVKHTRSAFASTDLATRLEQLGVKHLAIVGIQTEQCCETTTRDAADRGYNVAFVTEATLTFPIKPPFPAPEMSTADIIQRTEYVLAGRFAEIKTVDDLAQVVPPNF